MPDGLSFLCGIRAEIPMEARRNAATSLPSPPCPPTVLASPLDKIEQIFNECWFEASYQPTQEPCVSVGPCCLP